MSFLVNYKLTIQYDGTLFSGFQVQGDPRIVTVQGEIQKLLSMLFNSDIQISCAGRTDSGVHALGQVVSFRSEKEVDIPKLKRALNGLFRGTITVSSIELMPPRFHARFTATSRKYVYILDNSPEPQALLRNRAYWFPMPLNVEKMKQTAPLFMGRHDFTRFSKNIRDLEKPVRDLDRAEILTVGDYYDSVFSNGHSCSDPVKNSPNDDLTENSTSDTSFLNYISQLLIPHRNLIFFYFEGKSFLHSMVKIMVGSLIKVGLGAMTPEDIKKMLEPDFTVKSTAVNVPGFGLYLVGVGYGDNEQ